MADLIQEKKGLKLRSNAKAIVFLRAERPGGYLSVQCLPEQVTEISAVDAALLNKCEDARKLIEKHFSLA